MARAESDIDRAASESGGCSGLAALRQTCRTYPTFGLDWRKRWVQIGCSIALHRLAGAARDDWEADGLTPLSAQGKTACGRRGRLAMPGVFSRMGAPRCKRCCRMAGIPAGHGAPYNDKGLSEEQQGS